MKRGLFVSVCIVILVACSPVTEAIDPRAAITATLIAATETQTSTATITVSLIQTQTPIPAPTALGLVNIPNATIVYYDISGSTEKELRAQLNALGPVGYDGYKGDATTKWYIRWNWPGYGSSSCNLSGATVSYDVEVIMPRWAPPDNAAAGLVTEWATYIHALAEHEKGHVDFVIANYQSVGDAIKGATCLTAEAAAGAALAPIRQHDVDYDAATNHGATQGAEFP